MSIVAAVCARDIQLYEVKRHPEGLLGISLSVVIKCGVDMLQLPVSKRLQ